MASSLFNYAGSKQQGRPQTSPAEFLSKFNEFSTNFQGNPELQVKQLINSGRMSQEQFQYYAQLANQLRPLIK